MSDNVLDQFQWKEFPKKEGGETDEHVQKLSLSRRIATTGDDKKSADFMNAMGTVDGIEGVNLIGPYSLVVVIADCFDVKAVIAEVEELVKTFHSDLITPNKTLNIVT